MVEPVDPSSISDKDITEPVGSDSVIREARPLPAPAPPLRLHIFETYCRIHERIDLASLGQKLGMEQIAAEKWIVKMVSDAQLDAKIDSQSGHVILGSEPPDVYQQIIEKTKGLALRSAILASHIQKGAIPSA